MFSLGQSPALSLECLDAFHLGAVDHPHLIKAFAFDCPIVGQPVQVPDVIAKLCRRLLCCQRSFHLAINVTHKSRYTAG